MSDRPFPPDELGSEPRIPEQFVPAPELWQWALDTFIERASPLHNPEHAHLQPAAVGVLWTNVSNSRHMRRIVGMAEVPNARGNKWAKARHDHQLREWFGSDELDFLITLDAPYCAAADDASFCALLEHEMYHCGQQRDGYGAPRFRKSGRPAYGIRGHDVSEFVGVVRRYGAQASGRLTEDLVTAAEHGPEIAAVEVEGTCGTCTGVS